MMFEEDDDQINAALQRMASYQPNPRDAALSERWRDQEEQTLSQLEGGDDYGIGQLLRDALPGVIGIGADLASGNKGRGIKDILSTSFAQAENNLARDAQRTAQNREYALKQRAQRESNQGTGFDRDYKIANTLQDQKRIRIAEGNLGAREQVVEQGGERLDLAKDQASFLRNPNDPRAIALKQSLIANGADPGISGLALAALQERGIVTSEQVKHAYAPVRAQDAANETAATTGSRIRTENQLAPLSADTKAQEAAATQTAGTTARITTEAGLAPTSAATAGTVAAGTTAGRLAAEGDAAEDSFIDPLARDVLDPNRAERVKRSPEVSKEASKRLRASGGLVESIGEMVALREQEAQGLITPGRAKSRMLTERAHLEGLFAQANDMATIQEGDRASMAQFLGLPAEASVLDIASLLTGGDIKLDQLKGVQDALVGADMRTAREYGFGAYGTKRIEPMPSRRAPRAAPAAPSSAAPTQGAPGMVTIRLGGETRQVPADQARRLKAINPNLEVL